MAFVTNRSIHYEAAFEAYLQWDRLCYVAVDETRRAMLGEVSVKSLDFIVHGDNGSRLLVDVKGRRYPAGSEAKPRRVWECWSTRADIDGLVRWQEQFGTGWQGLLVFAYELMPGAPPVLECDELWTWRGRRYLWRAIPVNDYRLHLRIRSPRWDTVHLPSSIYRCLVKPLHHFTQGPALLDATGVPEHERWSFRSTSDFDDELA